jgi:hypothetical protein
MEFEGRHAIIRKQQQSTSAAHRHENLCKEKKIELSHLVLTKTIKHNRPRKGDSSKHNCTFRIKIISLCFETTQVVRLDTELQQQVVDIRKVVVPQSLSRSRQPGQWIFCPPHLVTTLSSKPTPKHKTKQTKPLQETKICAPQPEAERKTRISKKFKEEHESEGEQDHERQTLISPDVDFLPMTSWSADLERLPFLASRNSECNRPNPTSESLKNGKV